MMRDIKEGIKGLALGVEMSPQVTYMKDNIQKVLASRLQDIGNQFRRDQLRYQSGACCGGLGFFSEDEIYGC